MTRDSAVANDRDGLARLVWSLGGLDRELVAVVESMNGARFVHDQLELAGVEVQVADPQRVKGLAPLACKTDRIDAWVLAELARRELVPVVWLPDPAVRGERELARFRLHLVGKRSSLKNRVHAGLIAHGHPCPVSDLFGRQGRARACAFFCVSVVVRCCRGCGLRSGCAGRPSRSSSCSRCASWSWRVGSRARSGGARRRRWGSGRGS